MWPKRLIDPDGQEVEFVRQYGNMAEYIIENGKTVWLSYNGVGQICHGQAVYRESEARERRCVNC